MNLRNAALLLPLLAVLLGLLATPAPAVAQGAPFNLPSTLVGSLDATGAIWNFDGDVSNAGPWGTIAVTNTPCGFLVQPGTAQAGAIYYQGTLQEIATMSGGTIYVGDLVARGGTATGHARVMVEPGPAVVTHVDATLWNLSSALLPVTFNVCLGPPAAGSSAALIAADSPVVVQMGYDITGVQTTQGPDGDTLIAFSGSKGPNVTNGFWVFFFVGTRYLGTDTAVPSMQLGLAGSPAPGQINVQYFGYGDPVTITYTWDGAKLTPSGTPPGH